jgi:5-methylcytosine-specific restriction endonuclease McrA
MNLDRFVVDALRRASLRWQPRTKAKQAARVGRNAYKCACCGEVVPNKRVIIDHIAPVVDPETGFQDWNTYIPRLFCSVDNLQAICRECSNKKTSRENARRREVKREAQGKPAKRPRKPRKNKQVHSPGPGPD